MKANKEARRWVLAVGVAALLIGAFLGSMLWLRAGDAFEAKAKNIDVRNEHAVNAFEGDFRRSLLLTLANIDATAAPSDLYERLTGHVAGKHTMALQALRTVLSRSPSFAGRYQAVGFDPGLGRLALLREGEAKLRLLNLGPEDDEQAESEPYDLPEPAAQTSTLRHAVGFVHGLGLVALVNDHVYFWTEARARLECSILSALPASFTSSGWISTEFIAGRLQLSVTERQRQGSNRLVLRLDAADLRGCDSSIAAKQLLRVERRAGSRLMPAFPDAEDLPQRYGYLEQPPERAPNEVAANLPLDSSLVGSGKLIELEAVIGRMDEQGSPMRIAVGRVAPERAQYSLAFAANADVAVFKFDGPTFYIYHLPNSPDSNRPDDGAIVTQRVVVENAVRDEDWRLQPARVPWVYPPFAAARIGEHWRAAWFAPNGVWAVESSDDSPGTAQPVLQAPLIGEPDGAKLQFTRDGQFLVAQRVQFPSQVFVRIWDLRPAWLAWIADRNTPVEELRAAACRIVRMEADDGAFDEMASKLFQIDAARREPCPGRKGAQS